MPPGVHERRRSNLPLGPPSGDWPAEIVFNTPRLPVDPPSQDSLPGDVPNSTRGNGLGPVGLAWAADYKGCRWASLGWRRLSQAECDRGSQDEYTTG
jgi:hypothetical protein